MDAKRRRELLEQYKNRRPEMGVISCRCRATGESFLGTSTDTKASFNSLTFQLARNGYPGKRLQALWNRYGREGFELTVLEVLKYEDPQADQTGKLEDMRKKYFAANPDACVLVK